MNQQEFESRFVNQIICGFWPDVAKDWPDNTFDTIITDAPYGLSFMGKKWDYDVPSVESWRAALRVLKPGGTLLCFAGARTQHRMAVNIEDAGFLLKDCIMWLYGSGFPKATDISKQLDKKAGITRRVIGTQKLGGNACIPCKEKGGTYGVGVGTIPAQDVNITAPATPEAILWNGWKSHGLKPAYEPIIVAMKPNEGSYAKNALKWGVSGLNIDGGRIGHNETIKTTVRTAKRHGISLEMNTGKSDKWKEGTMASANPSGRFPANVILDPEAAAMVDEQSGELKSGDNCRRTKEGYFGEHGGLGKAGDLQTTYGDSGGASRVFYVAKASKAERNAGCEGLPKGEPPASARSKPAEGRNAPLGEPRANHHPTVKPLDLMRYLVRLTATPTGGIVLDMYCGSGTTLMACVIEGRDYCGIDKEPEYVAIANKRLEVCKAGVPVKEQRAGQYALFESMESMAKL